MSVEMRSHGLSNVNICAGLRITEVERIMTVVQAPTGIWTRSIVEPRSKLGRTVGRRT